MQNESGTNKRKKAAQRVAARRAATSKHTNIQIKIGCKLCLYYTTTAGLLQPEREIILKNIDLTEYIPTGRANAIPMKTLAALLKVDERAVRLLVQKAREQGAPICSEWENNGGYYLPADLQEAERYYIKQKARIRTAQAALNGITAFLQIFAVPNDIE